MSATAMATAMAMAMATTNLPITTAKAATTCELTVILTLLF
jgi:hypothetical protein